MGKRSRAKTQWLTMSQRQAKGEAKSGARLWFLNPKQPKPHKTAPLPKRRDSPAEMEARRGTTIVPETKGTAA